MMTPRILWAALFASTFIYLGIFYVHGAEPGAVAEPMLGIALAVVAAVVSVLSFVLPHRFHRMALANTKLDIEDAPDPSASVMGFEGRGPTIRVFSNPNAARDRAFAIFFTPFILSVALSEAVATFGLVLGLQGFSWSSVLPFFAASWILFLLRIPTASRIFQPLEEALGAKIVDRNP
jgi:hypothetical protein